MKKILLVIDMQKDFINGSLGTKEALEIVPYVKEKIENFDGEVIFTKDTHFSDYLSTQEGKKLPVEHCIKDTDGWQIYEGLYKENAKIFDKGSFGSIELAEYIKNNIKPDNIEIVGLCTDICVISNALILKAFFPEIKIEVDAKCCAGVTVESHKNALTAMKMCQIDIKNEE